MDINVKVNFEKEVIDFLKAVTSAVTKDSEPKTIKQNSEEQKKEEPLKHEPGANEKKHDIHDIKENTSYNEITLDDIRDGLKELKNKKGADAAKELLKEIGYKKVSDIKPSEYILVIDKIKEAS